MSDELEDDVKAISTLLSVLKPLDQDARIHVLDFVLKRLGISLTAGPTTLPDRLSRTEIKSANQTPPVPALGDNVDIRTFAAEKSPKTVNEKVAAIGFYLAHLAPASERKDYLIADDIKTYFIQAGFQLPTGPANMTLVNAKNAGYLNALDKGQYKLNSVGYNLVAHKLPGGTPAEKRRKTKKPAKPKARPKARK
jgi:hypothetical protein